MTPRRGLIQEGPRPRVGISACLLGERVRWDGDHQREPGLLAALGERVEWVPVCPEVELGLGVPREPIRLEGSSRRPRLVEVASGRDLTAAMTRFARARVEELARKGLDGYVLKARSPSCGLASVEVHARPRVVRQGSGLFARALVERLPLLPVAEEDDLRGDAARAHFLARVVAHASWTRALAEGMTRRQLAAFHEAHAALVRRHDPAAERRLAALVTSRRPLRALVDAYAAAFMRALATPSPAPALRRSPRSRRAASPRTPAARRTRP